MSVRVMTAAWQIECSCAGEKLVLVALADHADDDGNCHPSIAHLAVKTDISTRQVRRHLDGLAERGLLVKVQRRAAHAGRFGTWRYRLELARPEDADDQGTSATSGHECPAVADVIDQGTPTTAPEDVDGRARTIKEPSVEPSTRAVVPIIDRHLPDSRRLCDLLADLIAADGSKRPKVTEAWLDACDRMQRRDGRSPQQIENAARWAHANEFWRANVLSMPTLRAQFDRLRKQAMRDAPKHGPTDAQAVIARVAAR